MAPSVKRPTLDLSSGHDLRVHDIEPCVVRLSSELAWDSLFRPLSASLPLSVSLSLSPAPTPKKNKLKKKTKPAENGRRYSNMRIVVIIIGLNNDRRK